MDLIKSLVQAVLTFGAIAAIIVLVAVLFMVVFMLGTGLDRRLNQ